MHSGGHLGSYYKEVNDRLSRIDNIIINKGLSDTYAKMMIGEELQNIRKDLLNGILKIHN